MVVRAGLFPLAARLKTLQSFWPPLLEEMLNES